MKKLSPLLLSLVLVLSLAGCGEKSTDETSRQTPPVLTVTNQTGGSVELKSGSYDWTYTQGLQGMTAIACGAHPLDENCRDITPVLEMPVTVSAAYFYTVTLDFGDDVPDSVSLRCWPSDAWGTTSVPSETVTAQQQEDGTYTAALIPSIGIFAVDAVWDRDGRKSDATYSFCTQAAGTKEPAYSKTYSVGGEALITKLDISWLGGSVDIQPDDTVDVITVVEQSERELAENEKATLRVDLNGSTAALHIGFMKSSRFDGEKYLTVRVPASMVESGQLEEIDVEAMSALVNVACGAAQKIDVSTMSGGVSINGDCEELSVETTSGYVNISGGRWREADISTVSGAVDFTGTAKDLSLSTTSGTVTADADFYKLDFSAVSGGLTLTMQRAAEVDAETTSGGVTIHLPPSSYGFALDFDSVSGKPEIAFNANGGDGHWTYGDKASTLNIDTVSGNLSLD